MANKYGNEIHVTQSMCQPVSRPSKLEVSKSFYILGCKQPTSLRYVNRRKRGAISTVHFSFVYMRNAAVVNERNLSGQLFGVKL